MKTIKCQSCESEFTIAKEDLNFYEKIKIPLPTWCPECRNKRRMSWRNERTLYKRVCDATQKNIISMFSPYEKLIVYERDNWWKENFNVLENGQDIDFNKSLFIQFKELFSKVPLPSLLNENITNSSFCNCVHNTKNGYLLFASMETENVFYSTRVIGAKDSVDVFGGFNQEMCYENIMCDKSQRLFFSERSAECFDSMFLCDCRNLSNCLGCVNLRNVSYNIFNKQYSKEAYKKILNDLKLNTHSGLHKFKKEFDIFKKTLPKKYANILRCYSVTGDNITNSKNCRYCFDAYKDLENCAFAVHSIGLKDSQDGYGVGDNAEQLYEAIDSGVNASNLFSTICVHDSHDLAYCYNCHNSSYLFFCSGLRNKQYCILNKQYTKEQYEELVPKIIQCMNNMPYIDSKGRIYKYGEFFPPELSPFCYNETIAQEYFPLTKEKALEEGYKWKEKEERNYQIDIKTGDIPNDIKEVNDSIINKVIECEHKGICNEQCTEAFKIIKDELFFYKRMKLPLPRLCPNCRHSNRLKQRNPLKLWHRKCMKEGCKNEFETSYSPNRQEIIYCEKCYQQDVY
ncbi:MAG: zinc-ribbon domain containing protein [Candidatus Paceibacterota bacterium]